MKTAFALLLLTCFSAFAQSPRIPFSAPLAQNFDSEKTRVTLPPSESFNCSAADEHSRVECSRIRKNEVTLDKSIYQLRAIYRKHDNLIVCNVIGANSLNRCFTFGPITNDQIENFKTVLQKQITNMTAIGYSQQRAHAIAFEGQLDETAVIGSSMGATSAAGLCLLLNLASGPCLAAVGAGSFYGFVGSLMVDIELEHRSRAQERFARQQIAKLNSDIELLTLLQNIDQQVFLLPVLQDENFGGRVKTLFSNAK